MASNHGGEEDGNPWRNEIVQTIFGDGVGDIKQDFSCAVERGILLQGRMYVTTRFILFYCNIFGYEKKIKVPYTHITGISRTTTAGVIKNAITVTTAKREYIFRSFWDREEALALLIECNEIALAKMSRSRVQASGQTAPSSRGGGGDIRGSGGDLRGSGGSSGGIRSGASTPAPLASPAPAPAVLASARTPVDAAEDKSSRSRTATTDGGDDDEDEHDSEAEAAAAAALGDGVAAEPAVDPAVAFAEACAARRMKYQGPKLSYALSLAEFQAAFYAAPVATAVEAAGGGGGGAGAALELGLPTVLGMPEFHEIKGDTEVAVEPWSVVPELKSPCAAKAAGLVTRVRTYRFRHPIKGSPIGPPSTRANKTQRWQTFAGVGSVMDTVTVLEDIPYGDCFEVEERWVVTSTRGRGGSGGSVQLNITFEIKWLKSTMWKGTIESKTKSDMDAFFARAVATMADYLDKKGPATGAGANPAEAPPSAAVAASMPVAPVIAPEAAPAVLPLGPWWLPWLLALVMLAVSLRSAARTNAAGEERAFAAGMLAAGGAPGGGPPFSSSSPALLAAQVAELRTALDATLKALGDLRATACSSSA